MVSKRPLTEDAQKTREQLLEELATLRQRVAELEEYVAVAQQQQQDQAERQADLNTWRVSLLQQLTASLARALTTAEVFEVLLHQGLAALSATRGWVAQYGSIPELVEIVRTIGYPNTAADARHQVYLHQPMPATDVIRTGQIVVVRSPQEYYRRYPDLAEQFISMGDQALIALPLIFDGRVIGSLGWSFAQPQEFSEADCNFMMTLARQFAQALERAQLYEAERLARETAEATNRVKDEFLAILSHELRSPLNPILGWTKMLRTHHFNAHMTNRALDSIERNAKLQVQLIEDLLDVSHILQGKLRLNISIVNLVSVIEAAIETVRLAAESKSIRLHFSQTHLDRALDHSGQAANSGSAVCVAGDPARLQQIVWNLVSNAVKFTPEGGKVTVSLSLLDSHLPSAAGSTQEQTHFNRYVQINVTDTGKGIDPAFLPYIFEYFRQADSTITRQFGGLGLGLTIVRHLVELHGGNIQAESKGEGQGSTFRVTLPLTTHQRSSQTLSEGQHPSLHQSLGRRLHQVRVLVVDDDVDMREYVDFVLREAGARVALAGSAGEALAKLPRFKPDVLISDLGMPNVDGYTLVRQIRSLVPELGGRVPAIALTAYAGEYNQQQIIAAGFQLHIAKPVEPEDLVRAIAKLLSDQHSTEA